MGRLPWLLVVLVGGPVVLGAEPNAGSIPEALAALRNGHGLSLPTATAGLTASAQKRAEVLAASGALSHSDPFGRGPGAQMVAEGLPLGEFGEVLGAGSDSQAVWKAWLASPTHRAVLVTEGWKAWGLGSARAGTTRVWVLRFWKP